MDECAEQRRPKVGLCSTEVRLFCGSGMCTGPLPATFGDGLLEEMSRDSLWQTLHCAPAAVSCSAGDEPIDVSRHPYGPFWVAGLFISGDGDSDALEEAVRSVEHHHDPFGRPNDGEVGSGSFFWRREGYAVGVVVLGLLVPGMECLKTMASDFFPSLGFDARLKDALHQLQVVPWCEFRGWMHDRMDCVRIARYVSDGDIAILEPLSYEIVCQRYMDPPCTGLEWERVDRVHR